MTTPTGRAMFGMLGIFVEFEREMILAHVKAGLASVKAKVARGETVARLPSGLGTLSAPRCFPVTAEQDAGRRCSQCPRRCLQPGVLVQWRGLARSIGTAVPGCPPRVSFT
jgi:hypothetical protein